MNILIVNGFGSSKRGSDLYKRLCKIIDNILHKVAYKTGVDNFFYTYRKVSELEDIVYNLPENHGLSDHIKAEYKKNFDKLDLIFVDGKEKNNMPWTKNGKKLRGLVELCIEKKKPLYISGVAMLALLYHLAMNRKNKNFINQNGDYPTVEDINKLPYSYLINIRHDDAFLDFTTGDVYEFNMDYDKQEWIPTGNVGFHNLLYAEKYQKRGKYVLKEYKKDEKDDGTLVSAYKKEIKVSIIKQYCLHYLLKDINNIFIGETTLNWFPHNVCVGDQTLQYRVLCDSNFGAMIVEYCGIIGTHFHINPRYNETIILLENFIRQKYTQISSANILNKEISFFEETNDILKNNLFKTVVRENKPKTDLEKAILNYNPLAPENLVNKSRPYNNLTITEHDVRHVGLGFNNNDMIFISKNNVSEKKIPFINKYNLTTNDKGGFNPRKVNVDKIIGNQYMNIKPDPNWDEEKLLEFYKSYRREICSLLENAKHLEDEKTNKIITRDRPTSKINLNYSLEEKSPRCLTAKVRGSSLFNTKRNSNLFFSKTTYGTHMKNSTGASALGTNTSKNVAATIKTESNSTPMVTQNFSKNVLKTGNNSHPITTRTLNKIIATNLENNTNKKKARDEESVLSMLFPYIKEEDFEKTKFTTGEDVRKNATLNRNIEVIRLNQERKIKSNFREKFQKFDKELNTYANTPSIRCSSAYATEDEIRRREFIQSKKKWVCKEDFIATFGKRTENDRIKKANLNISNANDIFEQANILPKFRCEDRKKWICERGFIV